MRTRRLSKSAPRTKSTRPSGAGKRVPASTQARKAKKQRKPPQGVKPRRRSGPSQRLIAQALDRFTRAVGAVNSSGQHLQAIVEDLVEVTRLQERQRLIEQMGQANILEYLHRLVLSLDAAPPDSLPSSVEPYRHAPAALLELLGREWSLLPWRAVGEQLSLSESDLAQVQFVSPPSRTPDYPIQVRVVASGWKLDRRPVVKPTVELVSVPG
ncbi:MAG: hypothetical protein WD042_03425 [Phycisphaeraceae bacterium]